MEFSFKVKKMDFSKVENKGLESYFEKLYKRIVDFMTFLMIPFAIQGYLEESITAELKKYNLSEKKFEEYYAILTTPIKDNVGYLEQKNILKIAIKFKKQGMSEKINGLISDHAFKYGQIGTKYGIGVPWTQKDVLERIKFLSGSNPEEKLDHLVQSLESVENRLKEFNRNIKPSKEFTDLIKILRTYVYIRTFRTNVISNSFGNFFPLFSELAKRKKLTKDEILACFPHEIINGDYPSKSELKKRDMVALGGLHGKLYYLVGDSAEKLIVKLDKIFSADKEEIVETSEINGKIANKGIIKGIVKVLKDNSELSKVNRGDILVTAMTTPDFVPAMEKAAGFVTDEGGILCHAAIVSREMNKPCIISTKIATQILHDGDLVEVDADNGVVKVLEKAE
ncbi:hypothetical protein GOV14_05495 [Candidatus Pacearchaeota archaeon]|nr:hypothetical protein [Candidatus Pacearchaeota archaeon]